MAGALYSIQVVVEGATDGGVEDFNPKFEIEGQAAAIPVGGADVGVGVVYEKDFGMAEGVGHKKELDAAFKKVVEDMGGSPGYHRDIAAPREEDLNVDSAESGGMECPEDLSWRQEIGRHDANAVAGSADETSPKFKKDVPGLVRP